MKRLSFIGLLFIFLGVHAQEVVRPPIDIENFINELVPLASEDINYEEAIENLYSLLQNPLDINKCDRNDLVSLFFLSERQINELLEHRQKLGKFLSLYELQSLPSFDLDDIAKVLPFITLEPSFGNVKGWFRNATEHYVVVRADQTLEEMRGFKEDIFAGTQQRVYLRYRLSRAKDFSVGFISEKDAGEKLLFDYTAFHIQVQNRGKFKNIILGDYLVQFGQGLIFSAGYSPGKGAETVYTTRRSNIGAKPYNSLIEKGSFRGAVATYLWKNWEITGLASARKRDASMNDSTQSYFGSLLSSGFHRTPTEIANQNALFEQNYGANVLYKLPHMQLGFSFLQTYFDTPWQKRDLYYNFYEFSGKQNTVLGPNISIAWQNFNFFGEAARSSSGAIGYLMGWVGSLGKNVEWAFHHRNYPRDFHTFYGNAFSENSRTINEKAYYSGLKYQIHKGLDVSAYYDVFMFPWLKYRVDAPTSGHDYQIRLNYKWKKVWQTYVAYRGENKFRNESGSNALVREPEPIARKAYVLNSDFTWRKTLRLQSKLQYSAFNSSKGWAFMQDVEKQFKKIQLRTRLAYFSTDNYDSRIYAYENDVLYAVSFPAYFGKGWRYYGVVKFPINPKLDVWLRWAQTQYKDRDTIGSSYNLIEAKHKTDVKVQLKLKF